MVFELGILAVLRFDTFDSACTGSILRSSTTLDSACTSSISGSNTLDTACTSSISGGSALDTACTSIISGFNALDTACTSSILWFDTLEYCLYLKYLEILYSVLVLLSTRSMSPFSTSNTFNTLEYFRISYCEVQ